MDFKKKMKQRLIVAVSYMVIGAVLVFTDAVTGFENVFFFSFGIALTVMGVLRLFQYRKITRNAQTMRKQELAESDERTRMMSEKARSWAFTLSITGAGVWVIVQNLLGHHEEALPYAWFVCGMVVLYWISFVIIRKKY